LKYGRKKDAVTDYKKAAELYLKEGDYKSHKNLLNVIDFLQKY
jgi:hypothetical protein